MPFSFSHTTPEEQGIPSGCILQFLREIRHEHIELNALLILRNNHLVAEGFWAPFEKGLPHRLFSAGKTIVALAVLFCIQEGVFHLNDTIADLLADEMPEEADPRWNRVTLYHMLTMCTGQKDDPFAAMLQSEDRVQAFFSQPLVYEPGSHFLYNNGVPDILGHLVQKFTTKNVYEYLRPRLFEPLEMDGMEAGQGPFGIEMPTMCASAHSLLKLTMFLAQKGSWDRIQRLDAQLVDLATRPLVPSLQDRDDELIAEDTRYGYGFQIWRNSVGGFRVDGGRGQFGICLPDHNLIVVIMANEQDQNIIPQLVWRHITCRLSHRPLPENHLACETLRQTLGRLTLAFKDSADVPAPFSCRLTFDRPLLECSGVDIVWKERLHLTLYRGSVPIFLDCGIPGCAQWSSVPVGFVFPEIRDFSSCSIHRAVPGGDPSRVLCSCRFKNSRCIEVQFRSNGWLGGYFLTLSADVQMSFVTMDTAYSYNVFHRSRALVKDSLLRKVSPDHQFVSCTLQPL